MMVMCVDLEQRRYFDTYKQSFVVTSGVSSTAAVFAQAQPELMSNLAFVVNQLKIL